MHRAVTVAFACLIAPASAALSAPRDADTPERLADARDKIVCKSFVRTGSLADRYRTCKTRSEWDRERENVRQDAASRVASCRMNDAYSEPCK
jgi:hypothetical protein